MLGHRAGSRGQFSSPVRAVFTYRIRRLFHDGPVPHPTVGVLEGAIKDKAGALALGVTVVSMADTACAIK